MIVVRDVFKLKFGQAREAKAVIKEGLPILKKGGYAHDRMLTDFTGDFYTLVMESKFKNLSEYENALKENLGDKKWQEWYQKVVPLVKSGYREILTVVE